jgi:putative ABC transport system permease protein
MRALQRKLLRDLWRMRGQVVTITLILASGVAAYVCLSGAHRALARSRDAYYARYGFPDVFVHLEHAPDAVAERLRELPGVASVQTRLVEPVSFRFPGVLRPPGGRAISLDPTDRAAVGGLVLRRGHGLEVGRDDEILVLETFAQARGLDPGDGVTLVVGGHELELRVAGLVLSPEWIFPVEAGMASTADHGVIWMTRDALAGASGKRGAFNDVTVRLVPGADRRTTIEAIDRVLARWGGSGAYGRDRQTSDRVVAGEIQQLEVLATQVPAVFLLVAMFLLNVVLSRIVHLQRETLAVLRALGYTRAALARHVLGFASVIMVGGLAIGLGLGQWLAAAIVGLYGGFFRFPVLEASLDRGLVLMSVAVCVFAAGGGAMVAAWRAIRLAPADAMRPPAPARYRHGLLSRIGLARLAGPMGRMIVRDIERRPLVTGLSVVGVAFAAAIVVLGRFSVDSMDYLMDVVFARTMREDVSVSLVRPVPVSELAWFRQLPGVIAVEPMRTVPVRVRYRARLYDTAIQSWSRAGVMHQVLDGAGRPVTLPDDGAMMTALLAEKLGVAAGDTLVLERLDGDHASVRVPVARLIDDRLGMNIYMDLPELARVLGEEPQLGGVFLGIARGDPEARDRLMRALADVPAVISVTEPRSFRETYEAQSGKIMLTWTLIVVLFGSVIAVGVVFNTARVALSERSRDLATLRVLGFTRREVATVLLGQLAVQVILALPIGMVCGYLLALVLMGSVDPEQFRFPVIVSPATYAFASLVVLGSAIATAVVVRRKLDRIDIVSALKARD